MAREYEPQPETPLLGESVQLDSQETLTGDPGEDPLDSGYVPPDRPVALDKYGLTAEEEQEGEPLADKLAAEEPESEWTEAGRSGRLVAPDEGAHPDVEADMVARDEGVDGGAATAEEAAVHVVDDDET